MAWTIDMVARFLGLPNNSALNMDKTLTTLLVNEFDKHIVQPVATLIESMIPTIQDIENLIPTTDDIAAVIPNINQISELFPVLQDTVIDPITTWINNNVIAIIPSIADISAALPSLSQITSSLPSLVSIGALFPVWNDVVVSPITTWLSNNMPTVESIKNEFLDHIVNPILTGLSDPLEEFLSSSTFTSTSLTITNRFLSALKLPTLALENGGYYMEAEEAMGAGYDSQWCIGLIVYLMVKKFLDALYSVILNTSDFYDDYVLGSQIYFPLPMFSGKAICIATKIENEWVVNDFRLPDYDDWPTIKLYYPKLDFFPINICFNTYDLFNAPNLLVKQNGIWTPQGSLDPIQKYNSFNLACDTIGYGIVATLLYYLTRSGMSKQVQQATSQMLDTIPLTATANVVNNSVIMNKTVLANMAGILALVNSYLGTATNIAIINDWLDSIHVPSLPTYILDESDYFAKIEVIEELSTSILSVIGIDPQSSSTIDGYLSDLHIDIPDISGLTLLLEELVRRSSRPY